MNRHPPLRKLRKLREHHGITQREVAKVAGYSVTWVSYVERGLRRDRDGTLEAALHRLIEPVAARPACL